MLRALRPLRVTPVVIPVPDRVLLIGDSHGDAPFLRERLAAAQGMDCDLAFQLGDFGYAFTDSFLESVALSVAKTGVPLLFIDGNHDNHPWLRQRVEADSGENAPFVEIAAGLYYAPRGSVWTWKTTTFLAMGGAYSIDRAGRYLAAADDRVGGSWYWDGEEITIAEIDGAVAAASAHPSKVDIMLTHDVPFGVDLIETHGLPDVRSENGRKMLRALAHCVHPQRLFHGHWHYRYDEMLSMEDGPPIHVTGLGSNLDPKQFGRLHDSCHILEVE